jgi:hypothetical protein
MEQDHYIVEILDGRWVLRLNGRMLASFDDRAHAERAATVAARMSKARGHAAEIRIRSERDEEPASRAGPPIPKGMIDLWPELVSIAARILRIAA